MKTVLRKIYNRLTIYIIGILHPTKYQKLENETDQYKIVGLMPLKL